MWMMSSSKTPYNPDLFPTDVRDFEEEMNTRFFDENLSPNFYNHGSVYANGVLPCFPMKTENYFTVGQDDKTHYSYNRDFGEYSYGFADQPCFFEERKPDRFAGLTEEELKKWYVFFLVFHTEYELLGSKQFEIFNLLKVRH